MLFDINYTEDIYDIDLDDKIVIDHRENICSVCRKKYPHNRRYTWDGKDKSIKEVTLVTAHPTCRNLSNQVIELRRELIEAEFKLFQKQN